MNREAIESFVDEIRDNLPRMRRAFAIVHAWPDDDDARHEAHRLTHSIKGTAALVGVHTLSEIAARQETLLEQLMTGRRSMNDQLRDTLERMADLIEAFADGLLAGTVPEQRLLSESIELSNRHASEVGHPGASGRSASHSMANQATREGSGDDDSFREAALGHLVEMSEKLDMFRRDLTRWDLLSNVASLMHSLQQDREAVTGQDFAKLTDHAAELLQRVLDRSVPPTDCAADCLQACVDALEQRLDQELDESTLRQLHERIDELCQVSAVESVTIPGSPDPGGLSDATDQTHNRSTRCEPDYREPPSIELDDRGQLCHEMLAVFDEEADDHLRLIYAAFAELEVAAGSLSAIQDIRRSAHTLKGAAGSVGLRLVSKLSHRMEDLLDVLFTLQQPVNAGTLALLYDTTDALQDLVRGNFAAAEMQVTVAQLFQSYDALLKWSVVSGQRSVDSGREPTAESPEPLSHFPQVVTEVGDQQAVEPAPLSGEESAAAEAAPTDELVVQESLPMLEAWNRLAEPIKALPAQSAENAAPRNGPKKHGESLRVPLARIDSLMREVGELIINRSSFEQRMSDFARCLEELQRAVARMRNVSHDLDANYGVGALGGHQRLRGDGASLLPGGWRLTGRTHDEFDALELDRYTEFHLLSRSLAETTTDIGTVGQELRSLMGDFDQLLSRQGRLSRDTQDRLMRIRLLPLATLAEKLQRTVRVVAAQQRKEVEFLIQGGETEIDKLVLEELADPLMHLLRNAVDHGLEDAEVRRTAGKPERATIRVQAFQQGTQVVLRISDDGRGLNYGAIRETAVRQGLITADEAPQRSEEDLSAFIFLPGFSTAREITEVSGRGVGMDIVRDKVQKLQGTIRVDSQAGQGTTFTIRLPMTLAVTRALLLHCSNETFAMPLQSVVQILRLERAEIDLLGPAPAIRLGAETLPFVFLSERLGLRQAVDNSSPTLPVLVLADGDRKVAIAVDKILPGRDIVVKTLGTHLRKVRGLIGATLLGDGSVVPILDAADLVGAMPRPVPVVPAPRRLIQRDESPTIMIVDDSVSVRRVMANLLRSSGWSVLDAKDGLDALEKLQAAERLPDLFLLDIEMPRMDGYELLTSLRSREEHRDTPVVMVTSRAGDKHRQKALRLGATDYVVKPYQDHELLSLLRHLLADRHAEVLA